MNALARIVPAGTDTFAAWIARDGSNPRTVAPVTLSATVRTLADVIAFAVNGCSHKDKLVVRHHDALTERTRVLIYAIKRQSRPEYRSGERVQPLYAEPLVELPVTAFEPVEPWRWSPGCDVVGLRPAVVEGVRA